MLDTALITDVRPSPQSARQVAREFSALLDRGHQIKPAGAAKRNPLRLLANGYTPKHKVQLFGTTFYLTNTRYNETFRFLVGYVLLPASDSPRRRKRALHPRLFYKDASLIWRSPTHYARSDNENWIGKGDVKRVVRDGEEAEYSAEETTDLPLEIQAAFDTVSRRVQRPRRDERAVELVLRLAPDNRIDPYRDFTAPRRRAMADRRNLINGGRNVAYFTRANDPSSLEFVAGFEPDFGRGIIEIKKSRSRLYGGVIRKFRILSKNKRIQYQFVAAPRHVWIIPPQTLTTELSSYGVRTVDVNAADDLFVPGYEYHYLDDTEDPPELVSQIPTGFAGKLSARDPSRADASPWLDQIPVIRRFKKIVLGRAP